jgi:hypothetical protein
MGSHHEKFEVLRGTLVSWIDTHQAKMDVWIEGTEATEPGSDHQEVLKQKQNNVAVI